MIETTILSNTDINDILRAATIRTENDTRYAEFLLKTLCDAARDANIKHRFWEAVYNRRSSRFLVSQLHYMQSYASMTFNVEDIINEYGVLEKLAEACGQHVISQYGVNGENVNVYLEFKPPVVQVPTTLEDRRLEKETSW